MTAEYALNQLYSTKMDVYNFGVLIMEIITGKPNNNNALLLLATLDFQSSWVEVARMASY